VNHTMAGCAGCGAPQTSTAKFCGQCGARLVRPEPRFASLASYGASASGVPSPLKVVRCHGRRASVLFSDVAGFTALAARLDPEDVFAIMERAFGVILDAVHRHEGTVNQFLGDGVMAIFERGDEPDDHAHRALAAALAVHADLDALRSELSRTRGVEFRMRSAIHSGSIVIGAIGADLRADYTALGPTAHVAASLLHIAQPGQILVTGDTRRLAASSLFFDSLGDAVVAGAHAGIPVYAVVPELSEDFCEASAESVEPVDFAEVLCA
jgi:class 3 adenylate cyclase